MRFYLKNTVKSIKITVMNKFTLKEYVENGGALMILLGEGGEIEFNTNLNFLLEEYGMSINNGE